MGGLGRSGAEARGTAIADFRFSLLPIRPRFFFSVPLVRRSWAVGHSYICYGPLLQGSTSVLYEGKPVGTPDAGAFWRVIAQHKVAVLLTAPTALRAIKKEDSEGKLVPGYDLSHFKALYLAGERADPASVQGARQLLKVPVIDHVSAEK